MINHPEAAILGIGSVRPAAARRRRPGGGPPHRALTLAFDHRVADGAEAAALLGAFRALIETPELALV